LSRKIGSAKFFSITYRLFKLSTLEPSQENYGQVAIYKGSMKGQPDAYQFDEDYRFFADKVGFCMFVTSPSADQSG